MWNSGKWYILGMCANYRKQLLFRSSKEKRRFLETLTELERVWLKVKHFLLETNPCQFLGNSSRNLVPQKGYLWESWVYRFPPRSVWWDSEFQSLWRDVWRTLFQNTLQMIKGTALHRSHGLKSYSRFIQHAFPLWLQTLDHNRTSCVNSIYHKTILI